MEESSGRAKVERALSGRHEGTGEPEYILRTGSDELARLGFQHRIWAAQAAAMWERAGFGPGRTLLDVGCGPGYAAFDLAELVGPRGTVLACDQSPRFLRYLEAQAMARGLANITAIEGDAQELDLEPESADGAWARWLLCYLPRPERVVARVAHALKTGGVFAVQDYVRYTAITLAPPSPVFRRVIAAVDASWRSRGGDPDVGGRIPELMHAAGLDVLEVRPLVRTARPGSLLWQWPVTFFHNYLPVLVDMELISEADAAAFRELLAQRSREPGAFFMTPPMVEILAAKR